VTVVVPTVAVFRRVVVFAVVFFDCFFLRQLSVFRASCQVRANWKRPHYGSYGGDPGSWNCRTGSPCSAALM
jgi:hypothetical protein